jgi:uncharacterized membrane protein YphA (DoxX/SURF4 family)
MSAEAKGWKFWVGWTLTGLVGATLALSASMKLGHNPKFMTDWVGKFGYPASTATIIGSVEILCGLLLLVPRTAVLGAILVTGYLGGAVATHVRISDPGFPTPIIIGILAWGGIWLRDARVRALLPLR